MTKGRTAFAVALSILASLGAMSAPAGAIETSPTCQLLLQTTPAVEVDTNDDGYPEYRAPRIHDVTLCSDATVWHVTYPPTVENCSEYPRSLDCVAVRATIRPASAGGSAYGELCFTIEGNYAPNCQPIDLTVDDGHDPRTICIGFDRNGGHPCDGSMFALE